MTEMVIDYVDELGAASVEAFYHLPWAPQMWMPGEQSRSLCFWLGIGADPEA